MQSDAVDPKSGLLKGMNAEMTPMLLLCCTQHVPCQLGQQQMRILLLHMYQYLSVFVWMGADAATVGMCCDCCCCCRTSVTTAENEP